MVFDTIIFNESSQTYDMISMSMVRITVKLRVVDKTR